MEDLKKQAVKSESGAVQGKNVRFKSTKGGFGKIALSLLLTTTVLMTPTMNPNATDWGEVDYSSYHVVKKGDTMYSIAKKHGTVVERLMDANQKLSPTIYIGQRIGIPTKDWPWHGRIILPEEKVDSPYFVGSGDTLYSIAKLAGTSVANLKKINGLKSNYIQVGQQLKLSGTNVAN